MLLHELVRHPWFLLRHTSQVLETLSSKVSIVICIIMAFCKLTSQENFQNACSFSPVQILWFTQYMRSRSNDIFRVGAL